MDWFEELPDSCPPLDAISPKGEIYYRVVKGNPAVTSDFFSQRENNPNKAFRGVDECTARSISVFKNDEDAFKLTKLPTFKGGNLVAEVVLKESDGAIKKTFPCSHHSWWRSKDFNCQNVKIIQ